MENQERKHHLTQGFLVASIPALLFFPAVALLTVCPPIYGLLGMRILGAGFLCAELWAGWKLFRVVRRKPDWMSGLAILGLLIAALVLAATAWGFIAPIR
jgi:hypothetical protein